MGNNYDFLLLKHFLGYEVLRSWSGKINTWTGKGEICTITGIISCGRPMVLVVTKIIYVPRPRKSWCILSGNHQQDKTKYKLGSQRGGVGRANKGEYNWSFLSFFWSSPQFTAGPTVPLLAKAAERRCREIMSWRAKCFQRWFKCWDLEEWDALCEEKEALEQLSALCKVLRVGRYVPFNKCGLLLDWEDSRREELVLVIE